MSEISSDEESDSSEPMLSEATLLALRQFALGSGVALSDGDAEDVIGSVRDHFDVKDRDEVFHLTFGDVSFDVAGVKRSLGQTLSSTGMYQNKKGVLSVEQRRKLFLEKRVPDKTV